MTIDKKEISDIIEKIHRMPKYKGLDIPNSTIESIIIDNAMKYRSLKELETIVREKLHNIVALYLGDLNYDSSIEELRQLDLNNKKELCDFCINKLKAHASTKERGNNLNEFYRIIFELTGPVNSIADLACGIHPLGIPFMELDSTTSYYAYDIIKPRVLFLDEFIQLLGLSGGAFQQDILVSPPKAFTDVTFFFKELHRFEKRKKGCMEEFLDKINSPRIVVTIPTSDINNVHNLSSKYSEIVYTIAENKHWHINENQYLNEKIICIEKR